MFLYAKVVAADKRRLVLQQSEFIAKEARAREIAANSHSRTRTNGTAWSRSPFGLRGLGSLGSGTKPDGPGSMLNRRQDQSMSGAAAPGKVQRARQGQGRDATERTRGRGRSYQPSAVGPGAFYKGITSQILQLIGQRGLSAGEATLLLKAERNVQVPEEVLQRMLDAGKAGKKRRRVLGKTRKAKFNAQFLEARTRRANEIRFPDVQTISVRDFAELLSVAPGEMVKHLMLSEGLMVGMNQNINKDMANKVAGAFGKTLKMAALPVSVSVLKEDKCNSAVDGRHSLVSRPAVVTIMGHVDHGKTTLLDRIRNTRVAQSEAGGITQAMSAFRMKIDDRNITFIDTPGHAAFSEMRSRGARVTDIVVLVVAADDSIMEQTTECIRAAEQSGCPLVVAINKVRMSISLALSHCHSLYILHQIDMAGADVDRVKMDLINAGVLLEEFGGEVQAAEVSGKTGAGMDDLIEKIVVQAEVMNLQASVTKPAEGVVLETRIDKGLGTVVTAIVKQGSLKRGDFMVAGAAWGKVKVLLDDAGAPIKAAFPSMPVQIVGLNGIPAAGEKMLYAESELVAKEMAELRTRFSTECAGSAVAADILNNAAGLKVGIQEERLRTKVPFVIKADGLGSIEAIVSILNHASHTDKATICTADVVHTAIGGVTASDIVLAGSCNGKLIAFNTVTPSSVKNDALSKNVEIHHFKVLYDFIDFVEAELKKAASPSRKETHVGIALVKKVFKRSKGSVETIAGCEVIEGTLKVGSSMRVMRGGEETFCGKISSVKVHKENVDEVREGLECGIVIEGFGDFQENDELECFVADT